MFHKQVLSKKKILTSCVASNSFGDPLNSMFLWVLKGPAKNL